MVILLLFLQFVRSVAVLVKQRKSIGKFFFPFPTILFCWLPFYHASFFFFF